MKKVFTICKDCWEAKESMFDDDEIVSEKPCIFCGGERALPKMSYFAFKIQSKQEKLRLLQKYSGREAPLDEALIRKDETIAWMIRSSQEAIAESNRKELVQTVEDKANGIVRCPKCGSTAVQMVQRKWSPLTGFFTNKVDRVCMHCKHKW